LHRRLQLSFFTVQEGQGKKKKEEGQGLPVTGGGCGNLEDNTMKKLEKYRQ